ncbi:Nucleoid occlusion factor SlmA [Myxococcaceae bacterium]|jgi:AcrR family transcriptional regulator|nr:Nucleoid occlusion factor SlmA [Myxococcaceae bacterium]
MPIRKSAAERKLEIVEATLSLSDALGPDRISTEAIARAVGLTQPGIFRHFQTKQALWQAVAEWIAEHMRSRWGVALRPGGAALDRIERLIRAQLELIESTPAIPAILFSRELHAENDTLRRAVFELMNAFRTAIAGEIRRALDDGTVRADLAPDDAAFLLIGLVQGLAVRWSLAGRSFGLEAEGARLLAVQLGLFEAARPAGTREGAA